MSENDRPKVLYHMKKPDVTDLEYPFDVIEDSKKPKGEIFNGIYDIYQPRRILEKLLNQSENDFNKISNEFFDFPSIVKKYYWISPGERDGDSWFAFGISNKGTYFFYSAGCDYTGFDCQGWMSLNVSSNWYDLIVYGMTNEQYEKYTKDCTLIKK